MLQNSLPLTVQPWDDQVPLPVAVQALMAGADFARVYAAFRDGPADSLVCPPERALLFALVRATNARQVAEIGTYFAGTARVLAMALQAIEGACLHTIDPYGSHRVPALLAAWPPALRALVSFGTQPSSDFLLPYHCREPFDLMFIDGGHTYPLAFHDLAATFEALRPGGLLVLDNAEQPDVICAARDFSAGRRDLDGALVTWFPDEEVWQVGPLDGEERPFAFAVMRKALQPAVGLRPVTYHVLRYPDVVVGQLRAQFSPAEAMGVLRLSVHLRSLPHDGSMEGIHDLGEAFDFTLRPGLQSVDVVPSLRLPDSAAAQNNFLELSLRLQPGSTGALHALSLEMGGRPLQRGTTFADAC
jgi:predicted O-methyltransferase YrrM